MPNFAQKMGCKSYFAYNLYKNFTFYSKNPFRYLMEIYLRFTETAQRWG